MSALTPKQTFHRTALFLLAAGIGLGEGLGLIGLVLTLVGCFVRRREIQWNELTKGPMRFWVSGWAIWLLTGALVVLAGNEGSLKASEIFRHTPIFAAPLVFLSLRSLPLPAGQRCAEILIGVLAVSSIFGIYQWATGSHPFTFLVRADSAIATQALVPGTVDVMAATGFFFHRLKMAHVLTLAFGAALGCLFVTKKYRWALAIILIGFGACLMGTFAKAAIIATGIGSFAMMLMLGNSMQRKILAASAVVGLLGVWIGEFGLTARVADSVSIRHMIWQQATEVIQDYPAGVGLGNYSSIVGRYYDFMMPAFHVRTYPHQMLLSWWAESGVTGLTAVAGGWLMTMFYGFKGAINPELEFGQRGLCAALFFSLLSFWIIGLTHDVLYHPSVALMFFSVVGWILGRCENNEVREIE